MHHVYLVLYCDGSVEGVYATRRAADRVAQTFHGSLVVKHKVHT